MSRLTSTLFVNWWHSDELELLVHVPTDLQYDIMTKGLPTAIFDKFKLSLHVSEATAQTWGRGGGG
jgi:hypothetical protein